MAGQALDWAERVRRAGALQQAARELRAHSLLPSRDLARVRRLLKAEAGRLAQQSLRHAVPEDVILTQPHSTRLRSALRELRTRVTRKSYQLALCALVIVGVTGALLCRRSPSLTAHSSWQASSTLFACHPNLGECGGASTHIFFHTAEERDPFITFDLGRARVAKRLRVRNRSDGNCESRAVPLVALASVDGQRWTEVARRTYWFQEWDATFLPQSMRYLKLTVPRKTFLHLEQVDLY